jgi:hypothetical protein
MATDSMTVKVKPNDTGNPVGRLADAELHFTGGPLEGLKLIGFGIWERGGASGRYVTFPARQYSVNGERRTFALLRPIADSTSQDRLRELILQAYAEFEEKAAVSS